jgi:hypothetical protein
MHIINGNFKKINYDSKNGLDSFNEKNVINLDISSAYASTLLNEKLITKRPKDAQIWISNPISKIEKVNTEIEKFFGIKLNVSFSFKNYDYLEPISDKIEYAILQSSKPDVKFEFTGDGTSPMLRAKFTNYLRRGEKSDTQEYVEELERLMNGEVLITDNYGWVFSLK